MFTQVIGRHVTILTLLMLLSAAYTSAQIATGAINGTVHDPSSAVIPDVAVTLHNDQTGVERIVRTDQVGIYFFNLVTPGVYTLSAAKNGFKTVERSGVDVIAAGSISFDFELSPGNVTTTVTVAANAAILDTQTSGLSTQILENQVEGAPLNGRNFTELLVTIPGASPINNGYTQTQHNYYGYPNFPVGEYTYPSFSGQENGTSLFFIDGVNNYADIYGGDAFNPIIDDITQMTVLRHTDDASSGQALGATVNLVTKGGTSQLHGAAWEFIRNDALDSKGPDVITPRTPLHQNQFGFNVGGPVIIPHLYNGRRHTFFFGSLEEFILHTAALNYYLVPTPAELSGDFSSFLAQTPPIQLYNPFTTEPDPNNPGEYLRDPIPGNQMQSLLDPNMAAYAKLMYPAPVTTPYPANVDNGVDTAPGIKDQVQYTYRLDETLSDKDSMFARYTKVRMLNTTPESGGIVGNSEQQDPFGYNLGVSYQHLFGSRGLMHLLFGRNLMDWKTFTHNSRIDSTTVNNYFPTALVCGFTVGGYGPSGCEQPALGIANFATGLVDTNDVSGGSDTWQFGGDASWVFGAHNLKWGASFTRAGVTSADSGSTTIGFNSAQTANLEAPADTGIAMASFLMGVPATINKASSATIGEPGTWVDGGYVQDTWKVTNHFTANLGLRYDVLFFGYTEENGLPNVTGNWDLTPGRADSGVYTLQRNPGLCSALGKAPCIPGTGLPEYVSVSTQKNGNLWHPRFNNFQPRIGLSYQLRRGTVLRASFGSVVDTWSWIVQQEQNGANQWPLLGNFGAVLNGITPSTPIENVTPPTNLPGPNPYSGFAWETDPYLKTPYSDQWNVGVQQQITPTTVATVDYVGSHDGNLDIGLVTNVGEIPGTFLTTAPFPYLIPNYYSETTGRSSYNALEVTVNHRVGHGLTLAANYTWSKTLDIGVDGNYPGATFIESYSIRNPYDINADKGPAGFGLPQIASVSWVYALPFRLGNRWADLAVHGWDFNGIFTAHSGQTYTVLLGADNAEIGTPMSGDRPDVIGNPKLAHPQRIAGGGGAVTWFNTAAFVAPPPLSHGDEGRNSYTGDPYTNFDLSGERSFPLGSEGRRLVFRVDAFNAANWYQYLSPGEAFSNTFGSTNFGAVTPSGNREVQGLLKFVY